MPNSSQTFHSPRGLPDQGKRAVSPKTMPRQGLAPSSISLISPKGSPLISTSQKSADTALAFFGFRIGNPTLKLLNRKWSWESVLEAVKRSFPGQFVRLSEAVDKDALKVQLTDEQRAEVGCRIDQVETFFVEAKDQATKEAA